jgi:hypothetical protein
MSVAAAGSTAASQDTSPTNGNEYSAISIDETPHSPDTGYDCGPDDVPPPLLLLEHTDDVRQAGDNSFDAANVACSSNVCVVLNVTNNEDDNDDRPLIDRVAVADGGTRRALRNRRSRVTAMPLSMVYTDYDDEQPARTDRKRKPPKRHWKSTAKSLKFKSSIRKKPGRRPNIADLPTLEPVETSTVLSESPPPPLELVRKPKAFITHALVGHQSTANVNNTSIENNADILCATPVHGVDVDSAPAPLISVAGESRRPDLNSARALIDRAQRTLSARWFDTTVGGTMRKSSERQALSQFVPDPDAPPSLNREGEKRKHNMRKHDMLTKMRAVELAKSHGVTGTAECLGVPKKCVRRWREQETEIRHAIVRGEAAATRIRSSAAMNGNAELEFRVLSWIISNTAEGHAPQRPEIQNQALLIRNELLPCPGTRLFNFKAGDSWVSRFIEKHKASLGPWLKIRAVNFTPRQPKDPVMAVIAAAANSSQQQQQHHFKQAPRRAAASNKVADNHQQQRLLDHGASLLMNAAMATMHQHNTTQVTTTLPLNMAKKDAKAHHRNTAHEMLVENSRKRIFTRTAQGVSAQKQRNTKQQVSMVIPSAPMAHNPSSLLIGTTSGLGGNYQVARKRARTHNLQSGLLVGSSALYPAQMVYDSHQLTIPNVAGTSSAGSGLGMHSTSHVVDTTYSWYQ